jgi:hypothetical protein
MIAERIKYLVGEGGNIPESPLSSTYIKYIEPVFIKERKQQYNNLGLFPFPRGDFTIFCLL